MTESDLDSRMRGPSAPTSDLRFFAAALASSLTAIASVVASMIWTEMEGSETIFQRPYSEFILIFCFLIFVYFIFSLILCIFPMIAFDFVARRFRLRHPIWYVPYGALLGAGFGLLALIWIPEPSWVPDDQGGHRTIRELVVNPRALTAWFVLFVVPGAVGGLTYWWVGRRRLPPSH